ncbi:MAG: queuosine precursor transporter, partial [Actinomycetota bacterium]|nr:queuosine precursor transporter [Actinomycetota bacterium]
VVASAYVAAQMLADIASLRIITVAGLSMDAGTLIYPFTFTIRDLVHKLAGKPVARLLIFLAAAINVLMALLFALVAVLPADLQVGPQLEFGLVLAPVWRIVGASIVAEVASELIDTEVYEAWVARLGRRWQWGRVLSSNAIAIPVDSALFSVLAFGGVLSGATVLAIFWANLIVKGVVTLVSIPWIYLVRPAPVLAEHAAGSHG